ncbi:unnamed protein product, partial [Laminaria digitata]
LLPVAHRRRYTRRWDLRHRASKPLGDQLSHMTSHAPERHGENPMEALEAENESLRKRVAEMEKHISMATPAVAVDSASVRADDREDDDDNREEVSRNSLGKAGMTPAEIKRYSRHLLVPVVGVDGQRNLLGKTCLVIGAGGLASAVLPYLAGAGVGHIV